MKNTILLITSILILLLPVHAVSQNFAFNNINDLSGLPVKGITAVVRDNNGFIWAASRTGILRVASNDYRLYSLPSVTTNVMQIKLACRDSQLIAATQNGEIFRYNPILDQFEYWFTLSLLLQKENWVTNLLIDTDGKVWISTSRGIYIRKGEETIPILVQKAGMSYVTSLDGHEILACIQSSFYKIDTHNYALKELKGTMPHLISSSSYDVVNQKVWIGTYDAGVWQYGLKEQKLKKVTITDFPALIVRSILIPDNHSIWIGIDGAGIWILDRQTNQVRNKLHENPDDPSSLRGNSVYALLLDDYNRIWTATTSGGLQYTDAKPSAIEHLIHEINNPQSLHNNEVNHIITDSRGNLWIATNNGLSYRNARTHEWKQLYGGRQLTFLSLTTDKKGRIYAGTYGEGFYVLDESDGHEIRHYSDNKGCIFSPGGFVFATYTDSEGDVWLGGVKGNVHCYHPESGKLNTYAPQDVYCFAELSPGKILLGCAHGLIQINKETGKTNTLLSDRTVHNIIVTRQTIWICTSGDGIIGLDRHDGKQTHITTQQGLPSNCTQSMLLEGNELWIGTDNGLCRLNLTDKKVQTFANQRLLADESFNANSAYRLPDGRLAFGCNKGVIMFNPHIIDPTSSSGRIYFSDIQLAGRSIRDIEDFNLSVPVDHLSTLQMDYPQNSFTLFVLPIGYVSNSATFSWKLTGQDKKWSTYNSNRYINYTNLPAGKYTLCIRLYDGNILAQRQLDIIVKPPFWNTIWFRISILAVIIGILWLSIRYYMQRLHRRYADEKIRFFTQMAHDIRTSLMLIKAPIEELYKEKGLSPWGNRCLQLASEQTKRLSDTATQLLDFEKLDIGREQASFSNVNIADLIRRRIEVYKAYAMGKQIDIKAGFSPEDYWIQADIRMMERVIDNLLSNAVKYSRPGEQVEITFTGLSASWNLRIKDYGIGMSKKAQRKLFHEFYRSDNAINAQIIGSGVGLLMSQKYIALHHGKITVTSELDKGTTFDVTVPLQAASSKEMAECKITHPSLDDPDSSENSGQNVYDILIVEDNQDLCEFMSRSLHDRFHITTAHDGQEAWEMIATLQPDLVVSDIVMPHMDGFELCRKIKSTYETSHIPVILLTALSDKTDQLHGLGLGADNYLVKPFDMALLASRIDSIIRNRRTVFQKAIQTKQNDTHTITHNNHINDEFIQKAIECVRANIANEKFGKEEFASTLALSPSLLYKKIKALTNLSVVEFIRSIRLNYAMEKLSSGEFNATEVSEMCGFSSLAYFSKVFKEYFGKTPTEIMSGQKSGNLTQN